MGSDTKSWANIFTHTLLTRLPPRTWEEWLVNKDIPHEMPSFEEVKDFVVKRAAAKQSIEERPKRAFWQNANTQVASENIERHGDDAKPVNCFNCDRPHRIYRCHDLIRRPLSDRIQQIKKLKLCDKCLHPVHLSGETCLAKACPHCKGGHNGMLCPSSEKDDHKKDESDDDWNSYPKAGTSK